MPEQNNSTELIEPKASRPEIPEMYGVPKSDEEMLPWSWASDMLGSSLNYWIATVRPNGRPHVTPVWGVWQDGKLYFEGNPDTRRGRNIAGNPEVALHIEKGDDVVILEGTVEDVPHPDATLSARLVDAWSAKYVGYRPDPEMWEGAGLYVVHPRLVIAWSAFPKNATRWHFNSELAK